MSSIIRIQDLYFTEYVTSDAIAERVSAIAKALDIRFKGVDSIITIITLIADHNLFETNALPS